MYDVHTIFLTPFPPLSAKLWTICPQTWAIFGPLPPILGEIRYEISWELSCILHSVVLFEESWKLGLPSASFMSMVIKFMRRTWQGVSRWESSWKDCCPVKCLVTFYLGRVGNFHKLSRSISLPRQEGLFCCVTRHKFGSIHDLEALQSTFDLRKSRIYALTSILFVRE